METFFPKEFAVQTVSFSYILFNKIISEFEISYLYARLYVISDNFEFILHFGIFQKMAKYMQNF